MSAEAIPDDFENNLASLGLDFSTELSDVGVPVIDKAPLRAAIVGNRPPEADQLTPLALDPELAQLMAQPIVDPRMVPHVRRMLISEIRRLSMDPANGLNVDEDILDGIRLCISEAMQNATRENGIRMMHAARTPQGNVYVDVHNLALDFPPNCVHNRRSARRLRLATGHNEGPAERANQDESGWGMYLMGSLAVRNADGMPAAGLYDQTYVEVPVIGSDRCLPITRKVAWSIHGHSPETDRSQLRPAA